MNAGLITSYVIAGIIIISMVRMNNRVVNSNAELTMTQITREKLTALTDIIYDDFPNMGYDLYDKTPEIITYADTSKIQFYRKIDPYSTGEPELITWQITDTLDASSKNPNDKILMRKVKKGSGGVEEITRYNLGVTRFRLWYFDEHGLSTLPEDGEFLATPVSSALRDSIKQIYIVLEVQSPEPIMNNAYGEIKYMRSVWEKRFSPSNLAE